MCLQRNLVLEADETIAAVVIRLVEKHGRSIMRGQLRGIRYAAMAGVAMPFSFAAAQAQGVPGGSYLRSCTNVHMFGCRLVAESRRMDGSWERTGLGVSHCDGGVANTNGDLTCNYSGPGFGSSYGEPYSSARSRYYGCPGITAGAASCACGRSC